MVDALASRLHMYVVHREKPWSGKNARPQSRRLSHHDFVEYDL